MGWVADYLVFFRQYVIIMLNVVKHALEEAIMDVVLRKYGNSTVAVMPPSILKALHLSAGQAMQLDTTADGSIVLSKKSKPAQYTLEELLAQCDLSAPLPKDIAEWDNIPPVGNEVW